MPDSPPSRDGPDGPDDDARGGLGDFGGSGQDVRDGSGDADDVVVRNEDDDGWRFELAPDDAETAAERPPLEPGSPAAENVIFVLVGVALMLLLVLSAVAPLPW